MIEEKEKKKPKNIFTPTHATSVLFELIFVGALLLNLFSSSFSAFLSGDMNSKIELGWPFPFFSISMNPEESIPFGIWQIGMDLIIYLLIAYGINILLNLVGFEFKKFWQKIFKKNPEEKEKEEK